MGIKKINNKKIKKLIKINKYTSTPIFRGRYYKMTYANINFINFMILFGMNKKNIYDFMFINKRSVQNSSLEFYLKKKYNKKKYSIKKRKKIFFFNI
jgi:DNA mismatch repair ATPase MutL